MNLHGGRAEESALGTLTGEFGPRAKKEPGGKRWVLSGGGLKRGVFSGWREELERDESVLPLEPTAPQLRELAESLWRTGERLPLVIGSHQRGAFRSSVAHWVGSGAATPVRSLQQLHKLVEEWDGDYPEVPLWLGTQKAAEGAAEVEVERLCAQAAQREKEALARQVGAARRRLQLELGRYLAALGRGTDDLNNLFFHEMIRGPAIRQRMDDCFKKLGGYPEWSPGMREGLAAFADNLTEGQKRARQAFKELDAALQDPRWQAAGG